MFFGGEGTDDFLCLVVGGQLIRLHLQLFKAVFRVNGFIHGLNLFILVSHHILDLKSNRGSSKQVSIFEEHNKINT